MTTLWILLFFTLVTTFDLAVSSIPNHDPASKADRLNRISRFCKGEECKECSDPTRRKPCLDQKDCCWNCEREHCFSRAGDSCQISGGPCWNSALDHRNNVVTREAECRHLAADGRCCWNPAIRKCFATLGGVWGDWSDWSECPPCGENEYSVRRRSCINPTPGENGMTCVGEGEERRPCLGLEPCAA